MPWSLSQFDRNLAGTDLKPVYLLAGDEHLLVLEAADALRQRARELAYSEREVLEAGESGFEWYQLSNAGANLSLFASRRLLDLRLPGGRPGKDGAAAITEFCATPPPDTVLLITCTTWSKSHETAWVGEVEAIGGFVPIWPLKPHEMPGWLKQRATKRGVQLSNDALELLVERVEGNLLAAAQEIDKLVLLGQGRLLDAAAVEDLVADSARFDIFALTEAALGGDAERALRIAAVLKAEGEQVPGPLSWFATQLQLMARLAASVERGASVDGAMRAERVWQTKMPIYKQALQRGRLNFWEGVLAQAAHVERVGKGRAAGDAWRDFERLLTMVAQPKAARALMM
jgi:DNA polymerase III subunit delta